MSAPDSWPPEQIAYLTKLWSDGLPTAEIAKLLGVTKSAAIGKAHRLNLTGRASPIAGGARAGQPRSKPVPAATRSAAACQWPHGDPGTPQFQFCGAPAERGKPYCRTHCAKAYVSRRAP
jgi:GcrA cell cycle regulator